MKKVFIVEDEAVVALELKDHLLGLGYEVCGHAARGEAALAQLMVVRPDLVLMDINLGPGMSGLDVAESLRGKLEVPIIFLTAYADEGFTNRAARSGSFAYLVKPFDPRVLAANVELALVRHEATAALRKGEARFRALFDQASDGIFVATPDGRYIDANARGCEMLGYTREELLGKHLQDLVAPDEPAPNVESLSQARTTIMQRRILCKDGSWLPVELSATRLADGNLLGMARDISERKSIERALVAAETARAANEAKTMFLANMSHELRTPLNAVLGLSEALLGRTYGELSTDQERTLRVIHESGAHLRDLVNDVLDIARIEAGALPMSLAPTSLAPLVEQSVAFVLDAAEGKRQTIRMDVPGELPPVTIDARRVRQVLLNLLTNALKFSPSGATVRIGARELRDTVELWVEDSGPGIATEDQARIFEPFVCLDETLTRETRGVGLGLSLVKHLIELQCGAVRVESALGSGARFVVTVHKAEPPGE